MMYNSQSWAHLSLKLLNRSSLLSETIILGAMALNKKKSDERTDKIQNLSGSLMSDIRRRERSNSKSDFKD